MECWKCKSNTGKKQISPGLTIFEGILAGRTFVFSFEVSKKFFVLDKAPILMMILLSMAFVTSQLLHNL